MKKITLILVFALCAFLKINAQVTWPTYYVTPPTAGCNGEWAINTSSTFGSCGTTPYTYSFTPISCASTGGLTFSGDTLFVPLCSVPCNMVLMNSSGQTCSSSTGTATGIMEAGISKSKVYPTQIKQGSNLNIEFPEAVSGKTIQIFDNTGRAIENIKVKDSILKYSLSKYSIGIYYISISSTDGWTELHKIVIE